MMVICPAALLLFSDGRKGDGRDHEVSDVSIGAFPPSVC